jgi:alpha-glucosidase
MPKPKWYKNAIIYQIYPRSFADSNNDGVGDLRGITNRLGYLAELGVTGIWLSPINKSPMADFGYDISDYYDIDPLFGSLDDFDELIKKAHALKLKVLMDLVPNHSSDQHEWFIESRKSKDNPKRDWYIWKDAKSGGGPPTNWRSIFGGPAWTYDPATDQYYMHSFLKEQPDLNWANPEVQEAIKQIMRFWYERGVDGFRVDAILFTAKDLEFKDIVDPNKVKEEKGTVEKEFESAFSFGVAEHISKYLEVLTSVSHEYKDRCVFLEAHPENANPEGYADLYKHFDNEIATPFYFELMWTSTHWDAKKLKHTVDKFQELLPKGAFSAYVLGNHDEMRIASRVGINEARTAAMCLLTLPGTKFVYYGDELGMQDVPIPKSKLVDPSPKNRDPQRTPMQWSNERFAGFSEHKPWLPLAEDYKSNNVTIQAKDPESMLSLYRQLIKIVKQYPELRYGSYEPMNVGNPDIFAFKRLYGNKTTAVLLNFSNSSKVAKTDFKKATPLFSTALNSIYELDSPNKIKLQPYEGLIIRVE